MRSPRPIRSPALAVALFAALLPLSALAGGDNPITVTTAGDAVDALDQLCSLREAVLNANTNTRFSPVVKECAGGSGSVTDVIVLAPNTTYELTLPGAEGGDLDVANDPDLPAGILDLRFQGTTADGVPIIAQTVAGERVVEIGGADVEFVQLVVRHGATAGFGGGIYNQGGVLLLSQMGIISNSAASGGGVYSTGPVTLDRSGITQNEATLLGGGLMQAGSSVILVGSSLNGNSATTGGGLYGAGAAISIHAASAVVQNISASDGAGIMNADGGTLDIADASFLGNEAGGDGGAIRSLTQVTTQIANTQFIGNSAVNGGALHHGGASNDVSIAGSRFDGNSASTSGGAVFGVRVYTTDTLFLANTAASEGGAVFATGTFGAVGGRVVENGALYGGGVYASRSVLDGVRVEDNAAGAHGGGLYVTNFLEVVDSRITGNTAANNGAGIWFEQMDENDASSVIRSLVAGNVAQDDGGGLWVTGTGTFVLGNTTISENRAPGGSGSGLFIDGGKFVRAINVTLADNSPGENVAKYGTLEMGNSIITTPGGVDCVVALEDPEIDSLGNNLSDDGSCIGLDEPTDMVDVDVLLAPLAYTSGTMLTHALLAGSPAIDRGDAAACAAAPIDDVDQRGGARDIGLSCDIGAHEQGAVVSMTLFGDGFEGE